MQQTKSRIVNPLTTKEKAFFQDPYPSLRRLREESPVWWSRQSKYWLVSDYENVQIVLRDESFEKQIQRWKHNPSVFLARFFPPLKMLRNTVSNWLLNLNPPDHTRVRALVSKAFSAHVIRTMIPEIENLAEILVSGLSSKASKNSSVDLFAEFAYPFPLSVIGLILGIPIDDYKKLKEWTNQITGLIGGQRDLKKLVEAGLAMTDFATYLRPHIAERRSNPRADLLSVLVQAEEEGDRLNLDELVSTAILILIAGFDTTSNLIGNAVVSLDRFPEQAEIFKSDVAGMADQVIAEVLRFESPAQIAPRLASRDFILGGQQIANGDLLWVLLGSANRDPKQFDNPDAFDIQRNQAKNLAFGDGIHRCPGASLAQTEGTIAIRALYRKFPHLALIKPIEFREQFGLRGVKSLPASLGMGT